MKIRYVINLSILFGVCGFIYTKNRRKRQKNKTGMNYQIGKTDRYNRLLIKWKNAEVKERLIADRLKRDGITKVAVYGMAPDGIGWLLCNSLMHDGIEVAYGIDSNAEKISCLAFADIPDVRLVLPDEKLEPVDMIIVTALFSFNDIKEKLTAKYPYKVVSLEELVEEL